MNRYKLMNGLTVIEQKRQSESVTIQLTVKTGSNNEYKGIRGISHFIEHMLFEGTIKRKDAKEISNEIERLGGELNAYTENSRTCFYIKIQNKHIDKALEILSDIIKTPLFEKDKIEKERDVILKEINIFNDESRFYQWILFYKTIFGNTAAGYPAYGTIEDVKGITREKIIDYYNRYYHAGNCILTIVGDIAKSKVLIEKYFLDFASNTNSSNNPISFEVKRKKGIILKRKIQNSYFVLGYRTVKRSHKDSYVLDVIQAILGKGQSGRIFDEVRNKRGLAYEVGVHHDSDLDFGFFAIYLSADKSNISKIKKIIFKELAALSRLDDTTIVEAKGFIEGKHALEKEDTHNIADELGFWEMVNKAEFIDNYLDEIRKVTKKDIARVAEKYLNKNYSYALIEQQK